MRLESTSIKCLVHNSTRSVCSCIPIFESCSHFRDEEIDEVKNLRDGARHGRALAGRARQVQGLRLWTGRVRQHVCNSFATNPTICHTSDPFESGAINKFHPLAIAEIQLNLITRVHQFRDGSRLRCTPFSNRKVPVPQSEADGCSSMLARSFTLGPLPRLYGDQYWRTFRSG